MRLKSFIKSFLAKHEEGSIINLFHPEYHIEVDSLFDNTTIYSVVREDGFTARMFACNENTAYARRCAEELCDKLNEKI